MNLAASISKAKDAGYSDADIAAYIAKDPGMGPKVTQARKAGYSDAEIVSHLANPSLLDQAKDAGVQYLKGVKQGVAGAVDSVLGMTPAGAIARITTGNPFGLPTMAAPVGNLFSRLAGKGPAAKSTAGDVANVAGTMTLNAAMPGSAGARVANAVIPTVTSYGAGAAAAAAGAGPKAQQAARAAGGIVGAGIASVRPQNLFSRIDSPVAPLAGRAKQDPAAMVGRAQDYRAAGIDPTLADVVDDTGRGFIRAAANRPTPGRDVANLFDRARALDLPSRISKQARATVSSDPRQPMEIAQQLGEQRAASASRAFGKVRGDTVDLGVDGLNTLRVPDVVSAIGDAARRERDPAVRASLENLRAWASGDASTGMAPPLTIGMTDRISRVLLGKARDTNDPDLGATLRMFGEGIRNPARAASPGYRKALQGYADQSKLIDAAGSGEDFLARNTDEFTAATPQPGQPGNDLARATARRAIERKAGENPGAAPGIARRLAEAPEQQARNAHLLGPEGAQRFQQGMRLEAQAVDNARAIAPRGGSSTYLNLADERLAEGIQTAGRVGKSLARRDWLGLGLEWLRTRGLTNEDAESLVRMATDPRQTDQAIAEVTRRLGPDAARPFLSWRNAGLIGATAVTTGASPATAEQSRPRSGRIVGGSSSNRTQASNGGGV